MPRTGVVDVDGLEVEVTVRRVKRMNVRVHPPDGSVRLSVPPRTSDRTVIRFVRESRDWIDRHRALIADDERRRRLHPPLQPNCGVPGEVWWRFGRALQLDVAPAHGAARVRVVHHGRLVVQVPDPADSRSVLAVLDRWQRRELRAAAETMMTYWAPRLGVHYEFLGLRRMSTRWGSCVPARGRIWLSTHLVARPPALLEYVVVHELVHLLEASHGARFWSLMDRHLPDWRERRSALDAWTPEGAPSVTAVATFG